MPCLRDPTGTVLSPFIRFLQGRTLEDRPQCSTTVLPKRGGSPRTSPISLTLSSQTQGPQG